MNAVSSMRFFLLVVLLSALVLAAADLLVVTASILLLMFAGVLFGVFLNQCSHLLARFSNLSYLWSYALVVTVLVAALGAGLYYMGSQAAQQAAELQSQLTTSAEDLKTRLREQPWVRQFVPDEMKLDAQALGGKALPKVVQGLQGALWGLTVLLVIFFVGFYVAFDPALYEEGLIKLVPPRRRERMQRVLQRLRTGLSNWIVGQLIAMAIVGVATAIGLSLLGVPMAVPLGVLAALLTFVPNIGPILAAVPQALLALQQGGDTALYVLLFNLVLQTVESYVITPMVQRSHAGLPPALTIFAQLLLGVLVGAIGVAMAAPLAIAVMIVLQTTYIETLERDATGADPAEVARPETA